MASSHQLVYPPRSSAVYLPRLPGSCVTLGAFGVAAEDPLKVGQFGQMVQGISGGRGIRRDLEIPDRTDIPRAYRGAGAIRFW